MNSRHPAVLLSLVGLLTYGLSTAQRLPAQVVWQPLPPKGPDPERALRIAGPPLSLTSSDGAGLMLVSMAARAVVEDPLCFTELKLTFRNPQPRQIEGQFEITLPPGAAISRFAMRQGDTWQEGEVVELQAARAAYEDFLHRRQDPALLEKQAGNQFRARVFPIPPSGDKELILSYSEERPRADQPYRIHLRGLPRLQRLDIRAVVAKSAAPSGPSGASSLGGTTVTNQTVEVQKADFQPDVDFEVPVPVPTVSSNWTGLRHENLLVARVTPVTGTDKPLGMSGVTVLFDTSASRALGFAAQVDALSSLIAELRKQAGSQLALRVVAFDQDIEEIFAGRAADFGNAQVQKLKERRPLGASDLERALRYLTVSKGAAAPRVIIMSDGVATAGETEAPALQKLARQLPGIQRLDVVRVGGIHDETLLSRLVGAGLPADGVMLDGDLPAEALAYKLLRPTYSKIQVSVPGSQWVWPVELTGVQPGDQVLVFADVPRGTEARVVLSGPVQLDSAVTTFEAPRPLLERAWVGARIKRLMYQRDSLAASDPDLREALRHQIIDLSTKFRVLSDFTALLVLESESDYARFNIDRRALTDILTVGPTGIEVINRKNQPVAIAVPPPAPPQVRWEERDGAVEGNAAPGAVTKGAPPQRNRVPSDAKAKKDSAPERASAMPKMEMESAPSAGRAAGAPAPARPSPPMATSAAPMADAPSPVPQAAPPPPPPPPPPAVEPMEQARDERRSPPRAMPKPQQTATGSRFQPRPRVPPVQIASGPIAPPPPPEVQPYEGKLKGVMDLLKQKRNAEALKDAWRWRQEDAGDVLALIALGEVMEATNQLPLASRAYGSIIDLFPGRADLRRFAGSRLERVSNRLSSALNLAADTFAKAKAQRPDHPSSHRMLAYALLRLGKLPEAFDAIVAGATQRYPDGRFRGVDRILLEDVGIIAAALLRKEPNRANDIRQRLAGLGVEIPNQPSLRFVLSWETDANDVDFHIFDGQGNHAFYSQRSLASGGELYADVTTGYGPECFTIPLDPKQRTYPYKLQAHYYSRGPMGYGMGKLEILEHDGRGGLKFVERPFVIMVDRAYVDLGTVPGPL